MTTTSRARRRWFDPRFAIGIALVAVSVAGVVWIVNSADSSVTVLAARDALSPGDRVHAGDLVPERVRLPGSPSHYFAALPDGGLVVTRAIGAGELVPRSAVGSAAGVRVASVVVPVAGSLSRSIEPGAVVDLWAAKAGEQGTYDPPVVLAASATVVRVSKADDIIDAAGGSSVELLVPRSRTARVLEAVANADSIALVPAGLPAGG
jgi:hypothetical protein